MRNFSIYKKACAVIALSSSLILSGCGKEEVFNFNSDVTSTSDVVNVNGNNNLVVINGNNSISVNGVTITEGKEKDKLNIQVDDKILEVNVDAYCLDNIDIEIKDNENLDGNLVFIKNIHNYIDKNGNVEYGLILDIPENRESRDILVYSYTYEVQDEDRAIYTIYEIDAEGNAVLLETHIINNSEKNLSR